MQNVVKQVNQDLASFLTMPVQRIPRYILLLKNLLQRTPPMHPDGVGLNRALLEAKQLADRINEEKRRFENMQKVLHLEKVIDGLPPGVCRTKFLLSFFGVCRSRLFPSHVSLCLSFLDETCHPYTRICTARIASRNRF